MHLLEEICMLTTNEHENMGAYIYATLTLNVVQKGRVAQSNHLYNKNNACFSILYFFVLGFNHLFNLIWNRIFF